MFYSFLDLIKDKYLTYASVFNKENAEQIAYYHDLNGKIVDTGGDIWRIVFTSGVLAAFICFIVAGVKLMFQNSNAQERAQSKKNLTGKILTVAMFFALAGLFILVQMNGLDSK